MLLCLKFKSNHAINMKGSQVVYCGMKERLHEKSALESLMSDLFARSILSFSLQNKLACLARHQIAQTTTTIPLTSSLKDSMQNYIPAAL